MTEPGGVARSAASMGVATAVSRAIGFARILVIAAVLGTTYLGNTYQASNSFSNVLFELLAAGALSAVLVPTFVGLLARGDEREAERLAGNVLGRALCWLGAVTVVGVVAAPLIAQVLMSGADPAVRDRQEELSTFLLRFFVPQVLLYAVGTVSIAVLYAKRRFAITALAPIGLTVVTVATMIVFRVLHGVGAPGLELATGEKLTLAIGATAAVAAFVGVLSVALARTGFRLRPRLDRRDPAVARVLRLSGWAVFQHSMIGILLVAVIVTGNRVEGGVIAYQVAWVFFLAPYAVLAQPIHTAMLPELAGQHEQGDHHGFGASLRWALDAMATLVVPVATAMVCLALPGMRVFAFGEAAGDGVALLAAGVAALAVGLFFYSAFLLLARAYYALGDSRTPALVALGSALVGAATVLVAGRRVDGTAVVAVMGFGHSVAYLLGALVLGVGLSRRLGHGLWPLGLLRAVAVAAPIGAGAWWVVERVGPGTRLEALGVLAATGLVGGVLYLGGMRALGVHLRVRPGPGRTHAAAAEEPRGRDVDAAEVAV